MRMTARAVLAVTVRPWLWATAARQARRMVAPRWWRRAPFVPRPDQAYLRFRLETQYGTDATPTPSDVVSYLEWCRAERATLTGARETRR
jgi:hypothetical protein